MQTRDHQIRSGSLCWQSQHSALRSNDKSFVWPLLPQPPAFLPLLLSFSFTIDHLFVFKSLTLLTIFLCLKVWLKEDGSFHAFSNGKRFVVQPSRLQNRRCWLMRGRRERRLVAWRLEERLLNTNHKLAWGRSRHTTRTARDWLGNSGSIFKAHSTTEQHN